jgi:hypothetical protein
MQTVNEYFDSGKGTLVDGYAPFWYEYNSIQFSNINA